MTKKQKLLHYKINNIILKKDAKPFVLERLRE